MGTSMNPPRGYLHHGGQVLFSTKKYSYDHSTLGANFDKYAHLTNWSIHSLPSNYDRLLAKKDVIGVGCEWRFKRLVRHLKKEHANFSESDMWRQLSHIGSETLKAIISHDTCKRYAKKMVPGRHFEVYGMDVLMDDKFKCWLLECNNSPGLCDSSFPSFLSCFCFCSFHAFPSYLYSCFPFVYFLVLLPYAQFQFQLPFPSLLHQYHQLHLYLHLSVLRLFLPSSLNLFLSFHLPPFYLFPVSLGPLDPLILLLKQRSFSCRWHLYSC